jgi:CheY-like chemotaxis protein
VRRIDSHVEIVVSDTGPGISAALLPVIFDRFRQADSSSRRAHGGLGIGLALVRHLVEMHGGTVEAYSPGREQGATFTVKLPLLIHIDAQGETRVQPRAGGAVPGASSGALDGLRILVVDDERDALELFSTVLAGAGAETRPAASAAEALGILAEWTADVIVSDIEMPGQDGFALIRTLRASGSTTPAVAVTAYGRLEDRVRTLDAGFQMHIVKPVEPAELIAVIASLTRRAPR